jgi:hypothetical protein
LAGFSVDGATLLRVLDEQDVALRRVVRNTGEVFGALSERPGVLRSLISSSNEVFGALASRDAALAETFRVFPTFLRESRATLARLEGFSARARPVVADLQGPADDLGPTVRDLGDLSPDLRGLFRDVDTLIDVSERGLPDLQKVLRGADPLVGALHTFLPQLNPILSYGNFQQSQIAQFISNGSADLPLDFQGERKQVQFGLIDPRSFQKHFTQPEWDRGNAYLQPNALLRAIALGGYESLNCGIGEATGERKQPVDEETSAAHKQPVCFNAPPSLYNNQLIPRIEKGKAPFVKSPKGIEGRAPAIGKQR